MCGQQGDRRGEGARLRARCLAGALETGRRERREQSCGRILVGAGQRAHGAGRVRVRKSEVDRPTAAPAMLLSTCSRVARWRDVGATAAAADGTPSPRLDCDDACASGRSGARRERDRRHPARRDPAQRARAWRNLSRGRLCQGEHRVVPPELRSTPIAKRRHAVGTDAPPERPRTLPALVHARTRADRASTSRTAAPAVGGSIVRGSRARRTRTAVERQQGPWRLPRIDRRRRGRCR